MWPSCDIPRLHPSGASIAEEHGLLQPQRNTNGYREHRDDALLQVRQIRGHLDAGFNSETIAKLLLEADPLQQCPGRWADRWLDLEVGSVGAMNHGHARSARPVPRS